MNSYWVDANVLLRFITNDPSHLAERATQFIEKAERGELLLKVSSLVVAEVVWVLVSFYGYSKTEVADVLISLLTSEGIVLESAERVIAALDSMATKNVDFVDAYLAETARQSNESIASFDRDFRRLNIPWTEPD
ncbi:PIN domain-containing protein [Lyngbya sp. CCY1209]|jgi:predicted nucleic acid-binding protein|uniref:PIN domain-containing protein n=1 Tax=Lyngbya sp. CCY1209 TaxID=2886103 RepID=UPI002D216FE6|nr:PIN domain-containing protein [Lyngbya sp. CCY1209]MEB3886647.1 PIN domain-containing protein [Lyngbya sp. CCY1209]